MYTFKWLNTSIWFIDGTLKGQSEPGSNGNEGVLLHILQSSRSGIPLSNGLVPYPGYWLDGILPLCRNAVGVFYSPSQLDIKERKKERKKEKEKVRIQRKGGKHGKKKERKIEEKRKKEKHGGKKKEKRKIKKKGRKNERKKRWGKEKRQKQKVKIKKKEKA